MKINEEQLKKYARLYFARKKMVEKASQLENELEKMRPVLINHIEEVAANTGLDLSRISLPKGLTFDMQDRIYAKFPQGKEKAAKILKETGHGDKIKEDWFDSNSISALLRKLNEKNEIPEEWDGIIEKNPKTILTPRIL